MSIILKRTGAFLLLICLFVMIAGSCLAESDSGVKLIGGLQFGMDFQTAVRVSGYSTETAAPRQQEIMNANGIGTSKYLKGSGTIGGYPATVYVYFDQSGKLVQVAYYFQEGSRTHNSKGDGVTTEKATLFLNDYQKIEESLTTAYGEPRAHIDVDKIISGWQYFYNRNMALYLTLTPSVFPYDLYTSESIILKGTDGKQHKYTLLNASQYIVPQTDGCVAIEHSRINFTQGYSPYNAFNIHFVGYTHFDQDYSSELNIENNNSVGF